MHSKNELASRNVTPQPRKTHTMRHLVAVMSCDSAVVAGVQQLQCVGCPADESGALLQQAVGSGRQRRADTARHRRHAAPELASQASAGKIAHPLLGLDHDHETRQPRDGPRAHQQPGAARPRSGGKL